MPAGKTVVAESGYSDPAQIEELDRIGVDAVLIGESLMRSDDPEGAVRVADAGRGDDPRAPARRRDRALVRSAALAATRESLSRLQRGFGAA